MALDGNSDEVNGYNSVAKNGEVANVNFMKSMVTPIGSIIAWHKTFGTADSGTTDGTTASKLIQSGQNFLTTISIGMIVYNTTDDTFANVTAIDDDTTLSIDADIMVSGEAYTIYKTPQLPDGWVECDGSALSDSDSPYDGETLPDLNSSVGGSLLGRFIRGDISSGTLQGEDVQTHEHLVRTASGSGGVGAGFGDSPGTTPTLGFASGATGDETRPYTMTVVWIMRVK